MARFRAPDGTPTLLKLKSDWYREQHSLMTNLTPQKAADLAWQLRVTTADEIAPRLATLGVDFEGIEFLRPAVLGYLARRDHAMAEIDAIAALVAAAAWPDRKTAALGLATLAYVELTDECSAA